MRFINGGDVFFIIYLTISDMVSTSKCYILTTFFYNFIGEEVIVKQ